MGELGLNKIIGAVLASALGIMFLMQLPNVVFAGSAGHGDDHGEAATLSEQMCQKFHYCVEVAEAASAGAAAVEELFDLGAALASADLSRGERLFAMPVGRGEAPRGWMAGAELEIARAQLAGLESERSAARAAEAKFELLATFAARVWASSTAFF